VYESFKWLAGHYYPYLVSIVESLGKIPLDAPLTLGKLGFKEEPAGKLRVFAMIDCFTQ
jgi:hypothetical protein